MILDETLHNMLIDLQGKVINKFKLELPIEEINNLIDLEFYALILGVSKGLDVQLPKIGKFLNTNRVERRKERRDILRLLGENKKLNPDFDYEEVKRIFVKKWALQTEENKNNKSTVPILVEDLLDAETIKKPVFNLFKKLGNVNKPKSNEF